MKSLPSAKSAPPQALHLRERTLLAEIKSNPSVSTLTGTAESISSALSLKGIPCCSTPIAAATLSKAPLLAVRSSKPLVLPSALPAS